MPERKVAMVTGGARGIGGTICRRLVREGYDLHVSYFKSAVQFEEMKEDLAGQNVASHLWMTALKITIDWTLSF